MPRVQSYGQRQVSTRPIAGVKNTLQPQSAVAPALNQGIRLVGDIMQQRADYIDQAAALKAHNDLATWRQNALAESLQKRGEEAFDLPETVAQQFESYAGTLQQGLKNGRQRFQFERIKGEQLESLRSTLFEHSARQRDIFFGQQADAAVKLAISDAIANAENPSRIADELARGEGVIRQRLKGQAPETQEQAVLAFKSDIHEGVINRYLDNGKDQAAQVYYEEISGSRRGSNLRADGTQKGDGYFGVLKRPDGKVSTELSIGVEIDGKETEIPTLVPTLTKEEVSTLLSLDPEKGKIPDAIIDKAVAHAEKRIAEGKSPFAGSGEQNAASYADLSRESKRQPQISGDAMTRIERALSAATTQGEGLRTATDLWNQMGPKGDDDPIEIDKMEEAARAKFADEPKKLDAAIRYLRERKQGVDAGRKEREDGVIGGLWQMAAAGQSLAQVARTPEYRNAQGRVQAQISDYIVGRSERIASRAAAEESRAYTREQRAERRKYDAGRYMFFQYAKPEILAQMSDAQIWALTGDLGEQNAVDLLETKRKFATDKTAARAATIDADLFNELANESGFNVFAQKKSEDDKASIGRLRNDVEAEIAVAQARDPKRTLAREEKQAIMQRVIDRRVMVDGWFGDNEKVASSVVNKADQDNAYVPVAQIPPARLATVTNYLRSIKPTYQRLSDAEIQRRAKSAIQRAYAATLLGLGQDEVAKRLQEAP